MNRRTRTNQGINNGLGGKQRAYTNKRRTAMNTTGPGKETKREQATVMIHAHFSLWVSQGSEQNRMFGKQLERETRVMLLDKKFIKRRVKELWMKGVMMIWSKTHQMILKMKRVIMIVVS